MAKKKTRGTPRRAKRKPAPRPAAPLVKRQTEVQGQVVDEVADYRRVDADMLLGDLGLAELKLTPAEEKVLNRPVDESRVLIKPNGVPYLPHADYTRWFNEAFGRCGWSIVPVGKPATSGKTVVVPYVLFVHRTPVAFAMGEQDYFDNNLGQTYGDALESTVASGLRRVAKRLGVGLELWDRDWLRTWTANHAMPVKVRAKKRTPPGSPPQYFMQTQWRRKVDPPLPFEKGAGRVEEEEQQHHEEHEPAEWMRGPSEPEPPRQQRRSPRGEPDAGTHPESDAPITLKQRDRLVAVVRNSGRDDQEFLKWLHAEYGYSGTDRIKRSEYDAICRAVEAPGPMAPRQRRR